MIETPADYRSFVFCTANKNPVSSSNALGFPEFCFLHGKQKSNQFEQCSRVSGVLFFARQTKFQSIRYALGFPEFCFLHSKQNSSQFELCSRVSGVLFFARQTKIQSIRYARVSVVLFFIIIFTKTTQLDEKHINCTICFSS
jgi:hypothetical protein